MRAACTAITAAALAMLPLGCTRPAVSAGSSGPAPSPPAGASVADSAGVPEIVSLLGRPLYPLAAGDQRREHEAELAKARAALAANPDDADALIWVGRRLGYLWRMREAIDAFTEGIKRHPQDPRFYRHRGHRLISIRQFKPAIADLEKAAELIAGRTEDVELDGQPNARNIPLTTTGFNVWYHLALARYLTGDFEGAAAGFRRTMDYTRGYDDNVAAVSDWLYMSLRRLGREADAAALLERITPNMDIMENFAYHKRLLMYKGLLKPSDLLAPEEASDLDLATMGYGVGNWYLYNGDEKRVTEIFERVTSGPYWPAFGFIAAEVELSRLHEATARFRPQP